MAHQQAQADGPCLRYPENFGLHQSVTYEIAVNMLLRAVHLSGQVPYTWGYIDKPAEGQVFLIYIHALGVFPNDGIRFLEQETRYPISLAGGREVEVTEVKFGFIPGQDATAWRVRRRYRLFKGGHPQLVLVHYTRGQQMPINPTLMNQPVRSYPLRPINEPSIYVMGDKKGQMVYPPGSGPQQQQPGVGMGGFSPQAMLAQQNSNMEALERRRERERGRERSASMVGRQPQPSSRVDDDDSADETEHISTRTLALTRYRRNHELMNDVFRHAAFGDKKSPPPAPPYSIFNQEELDEKVAKLSAEVEDLQRAAETWRLMKLKAEVEAEAEAKAKAEMDVEAAEMSMEAFRGEAITV